MAHKSSPPRQSTPLVCACLWRCARRSIETIQRGSIEDRFMSARTCSNTSTIQIGFQRLLGLRLTVSEERPLIARCYSGADCGLPMLARVCSKALRVFG